ncbi:hypothetical protein, partial [Dialister hominis]|uniref:hypothetical protein n=1 Tax=Dialister hominis TaxID=2582419 RepID=UPI003AB707FD
PEINIKTNDGTGELLQEKQLFMQVERPAFGLPGNYFLHASNAAYDAAVLYYLHIMNILIV